MNLQHELINGRRLVISDKEKMFSLLEETDTVPSVVLVTAWKETAISSDVWGGVVEGLLKRGCTYFVCAGDYAEGLHDLIDNISAGMKSGENVVTSFHEDEAAEDVINFFVYTTAFRDVEKGILVAILNPMLPQDANLLSLLVQECRVP